MSINVNDKIIETNENGYLVNPEDWSQEVAEALAESQGLNLTERHWDVINYLRGEYFDNNGHQPNNRIMAKEMSKLWSGEKVNASALFDLFRAHQVSKQDSLEDYQRACEKAVINYCCGWTFYY